MSEERIRDLNRVTQAVLIRKANHVLDRVVQYLQCARARFQEANPYRPYCARLWRHFGPARCDDYPPDNPPEEDCRSSHQDEFYCCAQASKSEAKTYNWCVNHGEEGKWVIHTPAECQAKGKGKGDADRSPKGKVPGALKVSYAAITEDTDYDDDDDEF
jgi:hypothetical protein